MPRRGLQPRISVVIPAKDAATTIEATVESVLRQSSPAQEILVIDDQSRDGTADQLKRFDSEVRVLTGPGRGVAAARNLGLRAADADWVALLDADDRWLPDLLHRAREEISRQPFAVACFCAARPVTRDGRAIGVHAMRSRVELRDLLGGRIVPTTSASLVRREAALSCGGFYERLRRPAGAEDLDLWWRLAAVGECIGVTETVAEYVVNDERDARRTQDELGDLELDREEVMSRLVARGDASNADVRRAAAQMRSGTARYWLRAGHRGRARASAWRSVRTLPTLGGVLTLVVASAPQSMYASVVQIRRRLRAALGGRAASGGR